MSVRAGRRFLLLAAAALVLGLAWLVLAVAFAGSLADSFPTAISWPLAFVVLATVALVVGTLVMRRFVEAAVVDRSVVIQFVVGRARAIPVSKIDEVVVVQHLLLPTRTGPASAPRVILRRGDATLAAFTPRGLAVVDSLRLAGRRVTLISEPLTPAQVRRRFRQGVSIGEVITAASPWLAVLIGVAVLVWAMTEAFGR